MKNKDERKVDQELEKFGVSPRIYHFQTQVEPFTSITIAEDRLTWAGARRELDKIFPRVDINLHGKATRLRAELRRIDIYGVAICDLRDEFDRRRGRTIAKGRFLKHLKKIGVRKRR